MLSEKRISEIHSFEPKETHLENDCTSGSSVMYVNMVSMSSFLILSCKSIPCYYLLTRIGYQVGDLGSDAAPRARDRGAELTAGGG